MFCWIRSDPIKSWNRSNRSYGIWMDISRIDLDKAYIHGKALDLSYNRQISYRRMCSGICQVIVRFSNLIVRSILRQNTWWYSAIPLTFLGVLKNKFKSRSPFASKKLYSEKDRDKAYIDGLECATRIHYKFTYQQISITEIIIYLTADRLSALSSRPMG